MIPGESSLSIVFVYPVKTGNLVTSFNSSSSETELDIIFSFFKGEKRAEFGDEGVNLLIIK